MMEFTTPPSYGTTVVNVGAVAKDGELLYAGATNTATHLAATQDKESDWPEPKAIKFEWTGKTKDGQDVNAVVEGSLGEKLDRVDVMAEVPGFIKTIAGSVAGTRPYIYQVSIPISRRELTFLGGCSPDGADNVQFSPQDKLSLKLKVGETESVEEGSMFMEATFIS